MTVGADGDVKVWNFERQQNGYNNNVDAEKAKIFKFKDSGLIRVHSGYFA